MESIDTEYDKLVEEAKKLESETEPTTPGYTTEVDNFASQQGIMLTTDIRKLIESGMVEFLTKNFATHGDIETLSKERALTMEDFGFLATEWYAPSHDIHVNGSDITITYKMYKKMDIDEKFKIHVSRQLLMVPSTQEESKVD